MSKLNEEDFAFSVRCAPKHDKDCNDRTTWSFAIADAQPEEEGTPRHIKICPKYFTHESTKPRMNDKKCEPGNRLGTLCRKAPVKFKDFSVGALVLLHELTHLDEVGKLAGLSEVE